MKKLISLLPLFLFYTSIFAQDIDFTNKTELKAYLHEIHQELLVNTGEKVRDSILDYRLEAGERYRSARVLFEYNEEGENTRITFLAYSPISPWTINYGFDITIEYFGDVVYETDYSLQSGGTWEPLERESAYYFPDGRERSKVYEIWDLANMDFMPSSRDTFFYTNSPSPDSTLSQRWQEFTQEWINTSAYRNFYNAEEKIARSVDYSWDLNTSAWQLRAINSYEYDALGNRILYKRENKNVDTGDFETSLLYQYHFNGDNLVDSTYFGSFLNTPNAIERKIYSTYENELLIADTSYLWSTMENSFLPSEYEAFFYDAEDDPVRMITYAYDEGIEDYVFEDEREYYYSELRVATQELEQQASHCTFANPYIAGTPLSCNWTAQAPTHVSIYNLQGVLQFRKRCNQQEKTQNLVIDKALPTGIYFVIWEGENRILEQQKLLMP